jgi:hypothetical protein
MRRQFGAEVTSEQNLFDAFFGVVLPILCFVIDPFVFRRFEDSSQGLLERFQLLTFVLVGLEMAALCFWLVARERLGEWVLAMGGVLLAGALFCYAIGILLLPFSVVGLLFVMGALGFTPLLTGFVYLRNGVRAARLARNGNSFRMNFFGALVFGAVFVFAVSSVVAQSVSRFVSVSVEEVLAGHELPYAKTRALRGASWFTDAEFESLFDAYTVERDPSRKARLAVAYKELTGLDADRKHLSRSMD